MKKRIHRHLKKHKRVYKHLPVAAFFYMLFSFSIYLGLEVNPNYGDAGLIITAILSVIYIYTHTKKVKKLKTHNPIRKKKK